jgi:CRISPR-associated protein Cmr4
MNDTFVKNHQIFAMTTDPVYIGTGGYTIGRVDNTIVRDPITKVPKIPGSSLAGIWRYYMTLEIYKYMKDDCKLTPQARKNKNILEIFENAPEWITNYENNKYIKLNCAGQDDEPNKTIEESKENKAGHCGYCLVCKGFGFSKKDISWQGMLYFSDLNILFFPVFTMYGTRWITTVRRLDEAGLKPNGVDNPTDNKVLTKNGNEGHINLGWLYLGVDETHHVSLDENIKNIKFENFQLNNTDIVIVPENLFSQIVNSNLEVRTSVSIDPITGAAKEGALFTSEAIPRGTILYGNIRIFDKNSFTGIDDKLAPLPAVESLERALKESKHFFETLGIGGMTTRGFGRMKIQFDDSGSQNNQQNSTNGG